jgi:predicted RNA binding protein YcfA (HicA-like mRNA interferase family)
MPAFGPIKRRDLIYFLKQIGFHGPYSGGKHELMVKEQIVLTLPNPHHGDISKELLSRILKQANISKEEWRIL